MSALDNKALFRRWVEALNNGTWPEAADAAYAPTFVLHDPFAPPGLVGPQGVKDYVYNPWFAAFPDAQVTLEDLVAEGDKLVVFALTATRLGMVDLPSLRPYPRLAAAALPLRHGPIPHRTPTVLAASLLALVHLRAGRSGAVLRPGAVGSLFQRMDLRDLSCIQKSRVDAERRWGTARSNGNQTNPINPIIRRSRHV
jgi:hypothetical protein